LRLAASNTWRIVVTYLSRAQFTSGSGVTKRLACRHWLSVEWIERPDHRMEVRARVSHVRDIEPSPAIDVMVMRTARVRDVTLRNAED